MSSILINTKHINRGIFRNPYNVPLYISINSNIFNNNTNYNNVRRTKDKIEFIYNGIPAIVIDAKTKPTQMEITHVFLPKTFNYTSYNKTNDIKYKYLILRISSDGIKNIVSYNVNSITSNDVVLILNKEITETINMWIPINKKSIDISNIEYNKINFNLLDDNYNQITIKTPICELDIIDELNRNNLIHTMTLSECNDCSIIQQTTQSSITFEHQQKLMDIFFEQQMEINIILK